MIKKASFSFLLIVLFMMSCSNDDSDSSFEFVGYQYLPLEVGQKSIYQVDSIKYDDFTNTIDTIQFQRQEVVSGTFMDNANRTNYIVDIFQRANDSSNWVQLKSITKTKTDIRYELKEENLVTIPMVFPISSNRRWNSNALNTREEHTYRYKDAHEAFSINSHVFDSTVTISQRQEENLIEQIFTEEKYAAQVGLVYRKDTDLKTELNGDIKSGYVATISLIQYTP